LQKTYCSSITKTHQLTIFVGLLLELWRTQASNTGRGQNADFSNVQTGGTYNCYGALKGWWSPYLEFESRFFKYYLWKWELVPHTSPSSPWLPHGKLSLLKDHQRRMSQSLRPHCRTLRKKDIVGGKRFYCNANNTIPDRQWNYRNDKYFLASCNNGLCDVFSVPKISTISMAQTVYQY
jgi:hypothetical protein